MGGGGKGGREGGATGGTRRVEEDSTPFWGISALGLGLGFLSGREWRRRRRRLGTSLECLPFPLGGGHFCDALGLEGKEAFLLLPSYPFLILSPFILFSF